MEEMKNTNKRLWNQRVLSIWNGVGLPKSITGFSSFKISNLSIPNTSAIKVPNNLRLGHAIERSFGQLLHMSENFDVLYEGLQIKEGNKTIGELDFIIQDLNTEDLIHLELAYKFYLLDAEFNVWIGPNRKDSLIEKLNKLANKQFPLLFHPVTVDQVKELKIEEISQKLLLVTSLFIPFQTAVKISKDYQLAVKGYYLNVEQWKSNDDSKCYYCIPKKTDWGIDPKTNQVWMEKSQIIPQVRLQIQEKQSVLVWKKNGKEYSEFFVVWW